MSERSAWERAKADRNTSQQRRRGYQDAAAAFAVGTRIRVEREHRGMTQAALAERMGTTQPTVARLEAGGVNPSLDTLQRVADALGLHLIVDFGETASA